MPRPERISETAKQRSLRVPLDHFQQPSPLIQTKWALALGALAIGLVYVVWLLISPRSGGRPS